MKQTTLSQHGSSLLNYAISRLSPEVFLHPVWVRFGKKEVSSSLSSISDLLRAAKSLQENDPSGACQLLLICAVYQNYAGQHYNALRTAQQAVSLAEHSNLARETIWALWGACAISFQQGNYEKTESHLIDLQSAFGKQNEWMLSNLIDILRQSFLQPIPARTGEHSRLPRDRPLGDLLAFFFDWLQQWGLPDEPSEPEFDLISRVSLNHATTHSTLIQSFFSIQRWQGRWHTLMLAIRGELRLQWIENDRQSAQKRFSFWGSFLSSLRLYFSGRKEDPQMIEEEAPQFPGISVLPPAKENPDSAAKAQKKKPLPKIKKPSKKKFSAQKTPTITSVTVHMLGTFRFTIGDLVVRLPASRGLSLLKYVLLHHKHSVSRDVLVDVFWPDAEPETGRNSLNVAMHSLRKALRNIIFLPVITFQDGAYGLEPNLQVWLDVEEFERCVKAGQRLEARDQLSAAVTEYETAISLYQGDFLEQNLYDEWTVLERERLRIAYLDTLDRLSQIYFDQERYAACITVCQLILNRDRCREDTHCLLMCCYSRQGQYHLALRQYQICVEALRAELEVEPGPETIKLYERIRSREYI